MSIIEKNEQQKIFNQVYGDIHKAEQVKASLVREYYLLADKYRMATYDIIEKIKPFVEPRYQLSLEIIFSLYLMVFERIDVDNGRFTREELNPAYDEIKERVYKIIMKFI